MLGLQQAVVYHKLPGIRPSWSIKSFDSNPHLIFKFPFVDYIWSLFPMFRNYILHRKPRCSVSKLINRVFMKCGQTTNFTILLIFCKQTEKSHTAIALLQKRKDVYFNKHLPMLWVSATGPFCSETQQHAESLEQPQPIPIPEINCKVQTPINSWPSILFQNRTPQSQASKTTSSSLTYKLNFAISRYPLQRLTQESF